MQEPFVPESVSVAAVRLRVPDLNESLRFYRTFIGFREVGSDGGTISLSATGKEPAALLLTESEGIGRARAGVPGLYHVAIRVPDRRALASSLSRLLTHHYPLQGAADHGVSDALYLGDPHGNGIEIYCDKPRDLWPRRDGRLAMVTEPLDLDALLRLTETGPGSGDGISPGTDIGHIHLRVSSLPRAERLFHQYLGFEVTQRSFPGALFFAGGGYHHHIGTNIWGVTGSPNDRSKFSGLVSFALHIARRDEWERYRVRLESAPGSKDYDLTQVSDTEIRLTDEDRTQIRVTTVTT